jgi:hypothetical protein
MWPNVDPGPGPWTTESVLQHGLEIIIGRAKTVAGLIALATPVGAVLAALIPGTTHPYRLASAVLVVGLAASVGSLWVWNAIVLPRWWRWAVSTGVDLQELVKRAQEELLISEKDPWWRAELLSAAAERGAIEAEGRSGNREDRGTRG